MSEFVKLHLREKDWTFRALDLDQIEQLEPQFGIVSNTKIAGFSVPKEFLAAVAEIACESLRFKHADITPVECRKIITLATVEHVIQAIRGVSSLEPQSGEAEAGAAT